jgi:hypothetical protein
VKQTQACSTLAILQALREAREKIGLRREWADLQRKAEKARQAWERNQVPACMAPLSFDLTLQRRLDGPQHLDLALKPVHTCILDGSCVLRRSPACAVRAGQVKARAAVGHLVASGRRVGHRCGQVWKGA